MEMDAYGKNVGIRLVYGIAKDVSYFDFWNRAIRAGLAWWDRRRKGEPDA